MEGSGSNKLKFGEESDDFLRLKTLLETYFFTFLARNIKDVFELVELSLYISVLTSFFLGLLSFLEEVGCVKFVFFDFKVLLIEFTLESVKVLMDYPQHQQVK